MHNPTPPPELFDLNSKDRDMLEVNNNNIYSDLKIQKYMHSQNVQTPRLQSKAVGNIFPVNKMAK